MAKARTLLAALLALATLALAGRAEANDRRFTYTYQTPVLAPGAVELEVWNTLRTGRETFYRRLDGRAELELGLAEWLQGALYLNWSARAGARQGALVSESALTGLSFEWKASLLDPVADPVGLGLYLEPGLGPTEQSLEAKVLLDKRVGRLLLALNLSGEIEWVREAGSSEREGALEVDLGATYRLAERLFLGLEARSQTGILPGSGVEHTVLHIGPTLSYSAEGFWLTLTLLPQVPAPALELDEHERLEARLLLGIDL
jgi:hypothetical protein